jgi:hypothetical protein
MSTGAIIGIIIAVVVVAAIVVVASAQLRRNRIRRQFGPEYERLAQQVGPRKADAELAARQRRVNALDIHPLSAQQQAAYSSEWAVVQERFVDAPAEAVTMARTQVWNVMRDRGYPTNDQNASTEALSVHHAGSFEGYRQVEDLPVGSASTEQLRDALIRYRALFEDLTGLHEGPGQPGPGRVSPDAVADDRDASPVLAAENQGAATENQPVAEQRRDVAADGRDVAADSRLDVAADGRDVTADRPDRAAR